MAKYVDIAVKGSVENVQNLVQHAFMESKFEVKWDGPRKGKAEKGSKGANVLLGGFAQYYAVDFEIFAAESGSTLRLTQGNTGYMGGLWGASKVKKQFKQLSDTLTAWFKQQGVLLGSQQGKM